MTNIFRIMIDFDFEYQYNSITPTKGKKEVLDAVQGSFSMLETCIKLTTESYIKRKDKTQNIKKFNTFRKRVDYLKKKFLITKEVHNLMVILGRIRNKLFHETITNKQIFNLLNEIILDNDFVKKIENDCRKYQLLGSYCCMVIFELQKSFAPEEILHLEGTEDTKFEPYDGFI